MVPEAQDCPFRTRSSTQGPLRLILRLLLGPRTLALHGLPEASPFSPLAGLDDRTVLTPTPGVRISPPVKGRVPHEAGLLLTPAAVGSLINELHVPMTPLRLVVHWKGSQDPGKRRVYHYGSFYRTAQVKVWEGWDTELSFHGPPQVLESLSCPPPATSGCSCHHET